MYKDFRKSEHAQRTPEWYRERQGKVSSSMLGAFLDRLKNGNPSAKAKDYYKELAFERQFETKFEKFVTKAMEDGIFYEEFAKTLYEKDTGNKVVETTSYISDYLVATPDGEIGDNGLLECKVVGDNTFMSVLENGAPQDHLLQVQGQLLATGREWVDYIVVNIKTKAYIITRIERDNELIKEIYDQLHEPLELPKFEVDVKRFDSEVLEAWLKPQEAEVKIEELGF